MTLKQKEISNVIGQCTFCGRQQIVTYSATVDTENGAVMDVMKTRTDIRLHRCSPPGAEKEYWSCDQCQQKTLTISEEINQ